MKGLAIAISGTLALVLTAVLLFPANPAAAGVQAQLIQESGSRFLMVVDIGRPAPPTVIVLLSLPEGIRVGEADPAPDKFEVRSNTAKWLLRGLGAGKTIIALTASREVSLNRIEASVRYRDRSSGAIVETEAAKSRR